MKRNFLNVAGTAALMAGMAFGQSSAPATSQHHYRLRGQAGGTMERGAMVDRLATELNLTAAQKQKAETIFGDARTSGQSVRDQIRQDREALAKAVKSNDAAEIDKITTTMGPLLGQASANRAKAFAKFYQILTPEQKTNLDARMTSMMESAGASWRGSRAKHPQAPPSTR